MGKGIDKLIEAVKRDCKEGQDSFNMNGCDHEFQRMEKETDPRFIAKGMTEYCKQVSKCTHKYCDKLKWVLERAQQYADALGVSRDEVLDKWEENRSYWYMNYYQECNQPALDGKQKVVKLDDWIAEAESRFGRNWKFVCPACGHVQSIADFKKIGEDVNLVYSMCIGRYLGVNDKTGEKGCNYTVNGFISLNKTTVISHDFLPVKVFEMAPAVDEQKI